VSTFFALSVKRSNGYKTASIALPAPPWMERVRDRALP
jgi:hypothetical protein